MLRFARIFRIGAVMAAVAAIAAYFYCVDSTEWAIAPKCLFYQISGFKCPGCGTQRALHELAHLHIGEAFRYNPLLFAAVPYLALVCYLMYFGGSSRHPRLRKAVLSRRSIMAVFYLIVAYWIVRNVFGF